MFALELTPPPLRRDHDFAIASIRLIAKQAVKVIQKIVPLNSISILRNIVMNNIVVVFFDPLIGPRDKS